MSAHLSDVMDPWLAARDARVLCGEIDATRLPRLSSLGEVIGPGRFELRFGRDEEGRAVVTGRVQATIRLICQRCMREMDLRVNAEIGWGLLDSDTQAIGLPGHLDPIVVGQAPISPFALLEDELLLALPQVPMHPADACPGAGASVDTSSGRSQRSASEKPNPFAVLSQLKAERRNGGSGDD